MKSLIDLIRKLLRLGPANPAQASLEKLELIKQSNMDSLEALKDQIRDLVARIGQKKAELDDAKIPALRNTIEREIGELLNEVERLSTREDYIVRNITRISKLVEKLLQNQISREQGVSEGIIEDTTLDTEEVLASMEEEDRAMEQLESRRYRPLDTSEAEPVREAEISLEDRLREIGIGEGVVTPRKKPDLDVEE